MNIEIDYVEKLHPVFTKPKRIKIIVGGRGSTKSTGIADYVAAKLYSGELWCCARESLNSIEESVHRTMLDEIARLEIPGFTDTKSGIRHESGGRTFYRGLSKNITSLKSTLSGIDGLWIEEGEDITENTLRVLTASVRLNAKDTQKLLNGKQIDDIGDLEDLLADSDIKMPEVIITMNRGPRTGAIAKKWLARAEPDLKRYGYYEDDMLMVVQMNYTDMPKSWFIASGLEEERLDDLEKLTDAAYDHKWNGDYLDEVEGSIIKGIWFDACLDAHKLERLKGVFKPHGAKIASFDPNDGGDDDAAYSLRHGSIILKIATKAGLEIDDCTDWATGLAIKDGADWFVWDADGMGAGIKRQVSDNFSGMKTKRHPFKGSLRGSAQDNADKPYLDPNEVDAETGKKKNQDKITYKDVFYNNRAQYYIALRDRMYNTYRCVIKGDYVDPDQMISFDSDGIRDAIEMRSEISRIPEVDNPNGLIQIMNKKQMKANDIDSPNESDSVMMSLFKPIQKRSRRPINYSNAGIV